MTRILAGALFLLALAGCGSATRESASASAAPASAAPAGPSRASYLAPEATGVDTAGVRLVPIETPKGTFRVWTKRVGRNPRVKVLLLHGGPGATHEYFEGLESFLGAEGIEFVYYDQLGSAYSDQPKDESLWTIERFVDEVLAKQMDPAVVAEIRALEKSRKYDDPRYEQLLMTSFYSKHICRLEKWDRKADLSRITVPTLVIGATHDTMDPEHMRWVSTKVQKGSFLLCPNGSHLAIWDDQRTYASGLVRWLKAVDAGRETTTF